MAGTEKIILDKNTVWKKIAVGPIFIILAALLWSADGLLRSGLYSVSPAKVVFWEHILGLVILTPVIFFFKKWKEIKLMRSSEWLAIAVVGLFSGALGTIFYTAALGKVQYVQFSVVVLLQQLQPIWAILVATLLLREKPDKRFLTWATLAIASSYLVTFKDLQVNLGSGSVVIMAAILAILAGMMWGSSTSFSKIVLAKVSYLTATWLRFIFAALFAFIIAVVSGNVTSVSMISHAQWWALGTITLSTGMVALLIYYFGLRKTPARVSAICELVWPASAIFIDYFYFHKSFSVTQIIGVIILSFSIYQVVKFRK